MDRGGDMAEPGGGDIVALSAEDLVDLVNEWGDVPRAEAGEQQSPYPDAPTRFAAESRATHVEAANALYALFEAGSAEERVEHLDHLVRLASLHPIFVTDGWSVREVWRTEHADARLLARGILTMIEQFRRDPDARRLGTCSGDACADVYIDQSPGRHRRFCSLLCQNRHRTRAYRAKRRAERD